MIIAKFTHPENGYESESERVLKKLTVGNEYVVKNVSVGRWHTGVQLENVEGSFNSVLFDFYRNGELINIVKEDYRP